MTGAAPIHPAPAPGHCAPRSHLRAIDAAGAACVAAILAGGYFGVVRPLANRDAPIRQVLTDLERRGREASDVEGEVTRALARIDALDAALASAVSLQRADRVNEQLVRVTSLAQARRLSIAQMTPGTPSPEGRVVVIPVRIAGSGGFPDVLAFARDLAAEHRDWAITGLDVSGSPADEKATGSYQIDFVWYAAPAVSAGAIERP